MSKYIVEIKPEYEDSFKGLMILGAKDSNLFVDTLAVESLEELNSDYINEHFGELQDTAYQRGLDDAWEAARKLFSSMADSDIEKAFPIEWNNGGFKALMNLQPQEAIAKLKAYEDKQKDDDHIEVGDEVINNTTGTKGILLEPETEDLLATVVVPNHRWNTFNMSHINLTKTGRHFDIEGILEAMKQE